MLLNSVVVLEGAWGAEMLKFRDNNQGPVEISVYVSSSNVFQIFYQRNDRIYFLLNYIALERQYFAKIVKKKFYLARV